MIIEVGYAQSLPDLHQKVTLYFSQETSIQIVLIIKIFDLRVAVLANDLEMTLK